MDKLYFENPQELTNFIMEFTQNLKFVTINNVAIYIEKAKIWVNENTYLDIFDSNNNVICCVRIDKIKGINEYKIIKEWD